MTEFTRLWQFASQGQYPDHLIISETDQPNLVSIETTGRVLLTSAQWHALGQLASGYNIDGVRFAAEPEQLNLPLEPTE